MILFLYGEDTYRSRQKLGEIKEKYISTSLGDTNLSIIDCADKDVDFTRISRMVLTMPFLALRRLVIVKNVLRKGSKKIQDEVEKFLPKAPETTLLIFYEEGTPDRRSSLFKKLNKPKQVQKFVPLDDFQLRQWVEQEINKQKAKIEPGALLKLVRYVGNDLWRLANEIQKLVLYGAEDSNGSVITNHDVDSLVRPKIAGEIFVLIDELGAKNTGRSLDELKKLLAQGENELYILTMIVYQFRNLLILKDAMRNLGLEVAHPVARQGNLQFRIAQRCGLHPFVVQKSLGQLKNYDFERLKTIYQKILDIDFKIKTGGLDSRLALELFIIDATRA